MHIGFPNAVSTAVGGDDDDDEEEEENAAAFVFVIFVGCPDLGLDLLGLNEFTALVFVKLRRISESALINIIGGMVSLS